MEVGVAREVSDRFAVRAIAVVAAPRHPVWVESKDGVVWRQTRRHGHDTHCDGVTGCSHAYAEALLVDSVRGKEREATSHVRGAEGAGRC